MERVPAASCCPSPGRSRNSTARIREPLPLSSGSFLMTGVYQNICITAAMFMTGQASNPLAAQIATDTFHYPVTLA